MAGLWMSSHKRVENHKKIDPDRLELVLVAVATKNEKHQEL
jgi:hypothetical protein